METGPARNSNLIYHTSCYILDSMLFGFARVVAIARSTFLTKPSLEPSIIRQWRYEITLSLK